MLLRKVTTINKQYDSIIYGINNIQLDWRENIYLTLKSKFSTGKLIKIFGVDTKPTFFRYNEGEEHLEVGCELLTSHGSSKRREEGGSTVYQHCCQF